MIRVSQYIFFLVFCVFVLSAQAQDQAPPTSALRVETTPAAAELYIGREGPFTTPYLTTELDPGTYLVTVRADGYKTQRQPITLIAGEKVPMRIELEPQTGLVLVHTEPEEVEVKVNGLNEGATPLFLTDLPFGQHTMQLSKPGYIEKTIDLTISGRAPKYMNEILTPSSATLMVESIPSGASITLNGASHGVTPATIDEVPEGTALLALRLDGHRPFSENLTLSAGQEAQITAELEPIPASLRIVTIPIGARVYVNNQFQGKSPVSLHDLTPGEYRIRGELPGYEPTARTVRLDNGASPTEELRLTSNSGKLEIVTQPAGVKVFIDGAERGTTMFDPDETDNVSSPLTIDLVPVGEREVMLVAEKYFPLTFNVTIEKGETTILQPRKLEKKFIPDLEVRTRKEVYTGVYLGTLANGDVGLEIRPGIIKRISKHEIISQRPLQAPSVPE